MISFANYIVGTVIPAPIEKQAVGFFSYRSEDRTSLCYICVVFVSCHVRSVFFLSLSHFYHVNGILCYFCYVNGMLYTVAFMPCNIISLSCSCHARRDLPGQPAARLERTRRQLLQYVRHLLPLCHRHPSRGEHLWRPEGIWKTASPYFRFHVCYLLS